MNMFRVGIGIIIGVVCAHPADAQNARAQSGAGWRYVSIDMTLDIEPDERRLTATGTLTLRLDIDESFGPTLLVREASDEHPDSKIELASLAAEGLELTDDKATYDQFPGVVYSSLRAPQPFAEGDLLEVSFTIVGSGSRNQFVVDPAYATASWTNGWYPAPLWLPEEDFGSGVIATPGVVTFRMPVGWHAVTCGDLASRSEDGDRAIERWEIDEPHALGFAAGPFQVSVVNAGDRSVAMYRLSADPSTVPAQADALNRVIDAMSARFGEYPYSRFSIAEAPDLVQGFWAASEQGFILAKPSVFAAPNGNIPLFAHEAAHAWWGNLVGTDGDGGIFLSESLAQYGAVLAIETTEGEQAATNFLRFSRPEYIVNQSARGYFQVIRDGDDRPISSIERGGGVNHTIADAKGHWVHHMLRRRVGDDLYFGTLRSLKDRFTGGAISLPTFRAAFIEVAPDARLEQFFAQWLDRTGAPVIDLDWTSDGTDAINVTIRQRQSGEPYDLDLEIEMVGVGGARTEIVTVSEREQTVRLEAPFRTNIVRLDPNHRVLRWTPEYGSRPD